MNPPEKRLQQKAPPNSPPKTEFFHTFLSPISLRGWYAGIHSDGRVIFSVSGLPSSNPWLLSTSSLTPGQWHHIAVTFDGGDRRGRICIDGLLDRSAVFPAFDQQSTIQPMIGRASWVNSYYLPLTVDELKLYTEELSASAVLADLSAP